jgi:hypothetical protein
MTRDDIMQLALDAGIRVASVSDAVDPRNVYLHELERFAALVSGAERERLAAKFMEMHNAQQHRNNYFAFAARVIREEA